MCRKSSLSILVGFFLVVILGAFPAVAQEDSTTQVVIIMDASGSMHQPVADGQLRVDVAKQSIATLAAELPPEVNASLWAYGHRLPQDDVAASCRDIEEVIPLGSVDPAAFATTVNGLNAIGYTPIADSLIMAASTLPPQGNNIIVLMSDGEESCGGDPCAVAANLIAQGYDVRINTIGFAADAITRQQLQCIANVTNGVYFDAQDGDALLDSLREASAPVTGRIELLYAGGAPADLAFSAVNMGDPTAANLSATGSAEVPAGNYTVRVDTLPVFEAPALVEAGQTTLVEVPGSGVVQIVDTAYALVSNAAFTVTTVNGAVVGSSQTGEAVLLAGDYVVQVDVMPVVEETITVTANAVTPVVIGQSGTVQVVDAAGNQTDLYPLTFYDTAGDAILGLINIAPPVSIQPGDYTVRVETAPRTEQTITVTAGEIMTIQLGGVGILQVVDEAGNPVEVYRVTVRDNAGKALHGLINIFPAVKLQAGDYIIEVDTNPSVEQAVAIVAGETTNIQLTGIGSLQVVDTDGNPTADYQITVRAADGKLLSGLISITPPVELQAGDYIVEVDSDPVFEQTVTISAGEIAHVQLGGVGTLQIVDAAGNPTNDYQISVRDADGKLLSGLNFITPPVELLAGDYIVEVDSSPVFEQAITITADETVNVQLPGIGTVQVVDEAGNPTDIYPVTIRDANGKLLSGLISITSPVELLAGDYIVEVEAEPEVEQAITVIPGETVSVQIGN